MKTLSTAETKFISGGLEGTGLASYTITSTLTTLDHYLPSMRFDAARMAPGDTDEDNYNGFNDQGSGV